MIQRHIGLLQIPETSLDWIFLDQLFRQILDGSQTKSFLFVFLLNLKYFFSCQSQHDEGNVAKTLINNIFGINMNQPREKLNEPKNYVYRGTAEHNG